MKNLSFALAALLILGLGISYMNPVSAETDDRRATPSPTVEQPPRESATITTSTSESAPAPTIAAEIPGVVSLFFRDIGQRLQLLFTIDAVKDAGNRLEFAESNLQLAKTITEATQDTAVQSRAISLVSRANALLDVVNREQVSWSNGDPESVAKLISQSQIYLASAQELVNSIAGNTTSDHQTELTRLAAGLANQNTALTKFIQEKYPQKVIKGYGSPIVTSTISTDRDRDGIPDDQENDLGLKSTDFDSDGDGLSDRAEIEKYGTDPAKDDTDGDGFRDGLEILKGFNPNGAGALSTTTQPAIGSLKFLTTIQAKPTLSSTTLKYITNVLNNYEIKKK